MSSSNHPIIVPSDFDIEDAFSSTNSPTIFWYSPVLLSSPVLSQSPISDSQNFYSPEEISPPKDVETPIESSIPVSPSSAVGSSSPPRSIIPPPDYPFDESIFVKLHNSLWIISRPLGSKPMPPKRTSTSATPTMTEAAIQQLITKGVVAVLEAQAAAMANVDNPNRNLRPRETPVLEETIKSS
uniref:Reverse transcriptase domain-containing protein n=1 Tax=Tanacetum cinerariifolium TaxID=118510 RepID=A0A6L2NSY7_TANCI|nr:hypothetical protein [Tanacetum cinerariifolium]